MASKRRNFALYEQALGRDRLVQQPSWSESNRWFYGFLCSDAAAKERLLAACVAADIQVRPLWYPNHLQRPYAGMQSYEIKNALHFYDRLVNLPCSVGLTGDQVAEVVSIIERIDRVKAGWPAPPEPYQLD